MSTTSIPTQVRTTPPTEAAPRQVREWIERGEALLIDVREPDEHARERISGSRLWPLSRFDPRQAASELRQGQRLVFHCRAGQRSADAARIAAPVVGPGVPLHTMAGGIEAWKRENLPVESTAGAPAISVMRQVQMVIGLGVLAGAVLAWLVHPSFIAIAAFFGAGLVFAGATGTCGLAAVIARMPWNRAAPGGGCPGGTCG